MNISKYIIFVMAILIYSCSDDLGNYDYETLNDVTIEGLPSDTMVQVFERLILEPELTRELKNTVNDLDFVWRFGNDTVSIEQNLNFIIPTSSKFGINKCSYIIKDKNTGVRYYYDFNLNVNSAFGFGYYVLSEKSDKSSLISYLKSEYKDDTKWKFTSLIGDKELGNRPKQMSKKFTYQPSYSDYGWIFNIVTEEGEYPVIETNSFSFTPTSLVNSDSYVGGADGNVFAPKAMVAGNKATYFITDNAFAPYASGLLNPIPSGVQNYDWALSGLWEMGQTNDKLWGYDRLSNKVYTIYCTKTDIKNGVIGNDYLYNNIKEIEGFPSFTGYTVMNLIKKSNWSSDYASKTEVVDVIVNNGSSIVIYTKKTLQGMENYMPKGDAVITFTETSLAISGLNAHSSAKKIDESYYFLIGNSLYSSPTINPKLTKIVDIPVELGEPLKFEMSIKGSKIWVATFDEISDNELKGSVVSVDVANNKIEAIFKNVCGKPVQMLTADGNPWW